MRTLLAITRDTLLMLRRRRLFWLHFWLNVLVIVAYTSVAFHDKGWSFAFGLKSTDNLWLRDGTPWEHTMHCWLVARVMRWWVAGGAVILALFATSAVLPDSLEPGSAALLMPRARRRSLVLGGRFLGSLGYLLLHTTFVTAGLWLAVAWQMGTWHHAIWLGVPLAALLFLPLQAVAMLMGVLTRSATAALLVAILFAGSVWAVQDAAAGPEPSPGQENGEFAGGTGLTEAITGGSLDQAALIFPRSRDSILWLEREACPQPRPRYHYRALFRRLRIGDTGLSAVAADVIAATAPEEETKVTPRRAFTPLLLSSVAFAAVIMALAAWLLQRRDL
jgi:ABC-type transport system involved in multi-copper enzyme maturation permease subunit